MECLLGVLFLKLIYKWILTEGILNSGLTPLKLRAQPILAISNLKFENGWEFVLISIITLQDVSHIMSLNVPCILE